MIVKKEVNQLEKMEVVDGIFEATYEEHFLSLLSNDEITPQWLEENAIWMQDEGETEDEYALFRQYLALPIDKWEVSDIINDKAGQMLAEDKIWKQRRLLYLKYTEWFSRKQEEMAHLESIAKFRSVSADIMSAATNSSLTLVNKLKERIDTIDVDDIKARDIPSFIAALNNFVNIAADAQARTLAVDRLLQMFEEEINAADLKEHMRYVQSVKEELG